MTSSSFSYHLFLFSGIPEIGEKASENLSVKVENAFKTAIGGVGKGFRCQKLVGRKVTRPAVLSLLKEASEIVKTPDQKVFVYYNGHGDQVRDVSGDEEDGKDELWKLMGGGQILDDEISNFFKEIHSSSLLCVISDNCSSGTVLDRKIMGSPAGKWICLSSCRDPQDSLASSEGGIFTLFGLVPALESKKCKTIRDIFSFIQNEIQIPSQTPFLEVSDRGEVMNFEIF